MSAQAALMTILLIKHGRVETFDGNGGDAIINLTAKIENMSAQAFDPVSLLLNVDCEIFLGYFTMIISLIVVKVNAIISLL